jgi:glycosyltransferase involved in cell wall biosynthesis
MSGPLRVLLVSPVPGLDPPTGDVTYTEELLRHPPEGIIYETYADALAAGRLVELARRRGLSRRSPGEVWRLVHQAVLNKARSVGLLWREPYRYFRVTPGHYDLVHVHVFGVRWVGPTPPIVLSNGAPQPALYRDGYGWSRRRVAIAWRTERALAFLLRVDQPVCRMRRTAAVVTFTDHLHDFYLEQGLVSSESLHTIPCPTETASSRPTLERTPTTVGFVARNFEAKGGPTVLAAWPSVREAFPAARLLIAGADVLDGSFDMKGVEWLGPLPRDRLMKEFFAEIDVFAYPTTFDGPSLVLQEALSHGVPAITSDYGPMSEMIDHGEAGAIVGQRDSDALAREIMKLLAPDRHAEVASRAAHWFDARFASEVVARALGRLYRNVAAQANPDS